jgi:3-hydroxyacyl-[acyl-carrier-protein] dehydratase
MSTSLNVKDYIPQREPFLFVDQVVDHTQESVTTTFAVKESADFFKGHFPGNPIMPGVLTCEAVFQTGALLMALSSGETLAGKTAVVTRIQSAKFKNMAKPGDTLNIKVDLVEKIANASFMKGKVDVAGKTILTLEFACALAE